MIGIIGSGNVGANNAFFLAEKGVDDILLYDVKPGLAKGKALDMMEAAPLRGYPTGIWGTDDISEVLNADIIIITAGIVRQPGMSREALFRENRAIVEDYALKITNPDAVVIMVTEPVDMLTTVFARKVNLPSSQVMGVGGLLDVTRLRYLIAAELDVSTDNVAAQVVGRHSDDMIFLQDYCCVSGINLETLLSKEKIEKIFDQTRIAGEQIVNLAVRSSAYYGPSAVTAELAEAIVRNSGRVFSVSQMFTGQFGIDGTAMSLPSVIGKKGIVKTITPKLNEKDMQLIQDSAKHIDQTIKESGNA